MIVIFFAFLCIEAASSQAPNVCSVAQDYFNMENSTNCWYNPDVTATLSEMITSKGYPFETYKVQSDDGYITDLYRLRRPKPNKGVILLQHPATVTCEVWVDKGVNKSLAFILHDAGFDVWLSNARGSTYGKGHVYLTPKNLKYWDFGFHEMSIYDLPKVLELIRKHTQSKIAFVGHSMGSTMGLIYATMMPEHARRHVNVFVLTSIGGLFKNIRVPFFKFLTNYWELIYAFMKSMNYVEIISKNDIITVTSMEFCRLPVGLNMCPPLMKIAMGFNNEVYDPAYISVTMHRNPGGVALKGYMHYAQWCASEKFRMFDYGPFENQRIYKSSVPPTYPFNKITTPVYIMYGTNDWISTPEGVNEVYDMLQEQTKIYGKTELKGFNHADVLVSSNAPKMVYYPLVEFFNKLDYSI